MTIEQVSKELSLFGHCACSSSSEAETMQRRLKAMDVNTIVEGNLIKLDE